MLLLWASKEAFGSVFVLVRIDRGGSGLESIFERGLDRFGVVEFTEEPLAPLTWLELSGTPTAPGTTAGAAPGGRLLA